MEQVNHLFQVMTYDIDFAGVVSNIIYIRWLEDLRNLFADQILPIGEALQRGIVSALSWTEIDYLLPITFPDRVEGAMWLSESGRAKFLFSSEFISQKTGRPLLEQYNRGFLSHRRRSTRTTPRGV